MDITFEGSPDIDELFNPSRTASRKMTRIADFSGFDFVGDNLLVRKSERDLWRLQPDGTIERLFEPGDDPLEG